MGLSGILISSTMSTQQHFHTIAKDSNPATHMETQYPPTHPHPSYPPYPDINFKPEDRLIATIFKASQFDSILPNILSFLSVVELMFVQSVNRRWYQLSGHTRTHLIKRLHYGQFWSRIGILDNSYFITLTNSFKNICDINFSYCHFMNNSIFEQLIMRLSNHHTMIRLNIFYCYHLNDEIINTIVQRFPNLTDLNIGRCHLMTERGIMKLAELTKLKTLNLVNTNNELFLL
jgi:hypothetical protein